MRTLRIGLGLLGLIAFCGTALAQTLINDGPTTDSQTPRSGQPPAVSVPAPDLSNKPFGAGLFLNAQPKQASPGSNPNYQVMPGDQVSMHLYGALEQDTVQTVDPQGNIFVQGVGPVPVKGVPAGTLSNHIEQKVRSTYPSQDVQVYGSIVNGQTIGVFVTGFVKQPGRHLGTPGDSLLDYLVRAGGILDGSGSYRDVAIKRGGRVLARADLYDFLLDGTLPTVSLQDNDTIVVGPQRPVVKVTGSARNVAVFEMSGGTTMSGAELIRLASPLPSVSHALVLGSRDRVPVSNYIPLDSFQSYALRDQDEVTFEDDVAGDTVTVSLEGEYEGPSRFVIAKGTTLMTLLNQVPVNASFTNWQAVYIKRKSVAVQQKAALETALDRLERSVLTAVVQTSGEAALRSAEAQLVMQFIAKARMVQPDGTLVVATHSGTTADITLEEGDIVVLPRRSSTVLVAGEVLAPQTMVWEADLSVSDYVGRAGGFTDRADTGRILIQKPNGAISLEGNPTVAAGDQVVILPEIQFKGFQFISDLTEVIFRIAGVALLATK